MEPETSHCNHAKGNSKSISNPQVSLDNKEATDGILSAAEAEN